MIVEISEISNSENVISSLKWIVEEANSDSGRGDIFLQAIFNKILHEKIYIRSWDKQEEFIRETLQTLVLHNREIRKRFADVSKRFAEPVHIVKPKIEHTEQE